MTRRRARGPLRDGRPAASGPRKSLVGRGGFEPPKAEPPDLQSGPFDRSGTCPGTIPLPEPQRPAVCPLVNALPLEPAVRLELTTFGLQNRCSAIELRWRAGAGRTTRTVECRELNILAHHPAKSIKKCRFFVYFPQHRKSADTGPHVKDKEERPGTRAQDAEGDPPPRARRGEKKRRAGRAIIRLPGRTRMPPRDGRRAAARARRAGRRECGCK